MVKGAVSNKWAVLKHGFLIIKNLLYWNKLYRNNTTNKNNETSMLPFGKTQEHDYVHGCSMWLLKNKL